MNLIFFVLQVYCFSMKYACCAYWFFIILCSIIVHLPRLGFRRYYDVLIHTAIPMERQHPNPVTTIRQKIVPELTTAEDSFYNINSMLRSSCFQ